MRNGRTKRVIAWGLCAAVAAQGALLFVSAPEIGMPVAHAGAKTKTITWLIGSVVSTTAVASAATTTMAFTISIPDIVPTAQPIRSAYVMYNAHWNNTTSVSASTFTVFKQGGAAQALTAPTALNNSGEDLQLGLRLNATAAMQTIIGNASGTYAMYFTVNLTGPTRIGESARLIVTYDYDPDAATQVNTVYHHVYSSSTQVGTSAVTSPSFNLNLPEASATSTAVTGASSTNQFWIEYRGRLSGANITATVGWDSETTSTATFTQASDSFSFLLIVAPKTGGASPSAAHTFKMISSAATSISGPNAIAVATYTFNYASTTKLRKTLQVLLMQSALTATSTQINTTSTINIPETSPSSTNAFLMGRSIFTVAANPGMNATTTTGGCTFLTPTAITEGAASTDTTGYAVIAWDVTSNLKFTTNGAKTVCSSFSSSAAANVRGMMLFWSYDYTKVGSAAGARTNENISFLGASNMTAGTTFTTSTVDARVANASATAQAAWLDAAYNDNGTGNTVAAQAIALGTGSSTNTFTYVNDGENTFGEVFSTSTPTGLQNNVGVTVNCGTSCISDASYNAWFQSDVTAANITQDHYHWRYDNGSESGATQAAGEDTSTTTPKGTNFRLRFELNNQGDATSSAAFRIEYQQSATSGAWTQLATSSAGSAHWQTASSSQVSHGTASTNIAASSGGVTDGNIFFTAGQVVATSTANQASAMTLTGTQFTDMEYAVKATANAVDGATYYFRLTNAGTALGTYAIYASSTVPSSNSAPSVSNVTFNHGNALTLTPNATTSFDINFTVTDAQGCGDVFTSGGVTSTAFRFGVGTSCGASNLNCYTVSTSTHNCSAGTSANATSTVELYYFADATDASSSYAAQDWEAFVVARDAANATGSATSTGVEANTLLAINVTPATTSYGTVAAGADTGAVNQSSLVANAGNSSTTLKVSGTALTLGSNSIATSSQHYATSSFTFGGSEGVLSDALAAVSGFLLRSPTSTAAVSRATYWGITIPLGSATGTYQGTNIFTAVFSP